MQRNSNIQFIGKLSLFAVLLTAMVSIALAQETVSVGSSRPVNAKLPANASRVTEGNVPADSLLFNSFNTKAKGAVHTSGNWSAVEILAELP